MTRTAAIHAAIAANDLTATYNNADRAMGYVTWTIKVGGEFSAKTIEIELDVEFGGVVIDLCDSDLRLGRSRFNCAGMTAERIEKTATRRVKNLRKKAA